MSLKNETQSPPAHTQSVLFVCLGNICRSPTAESVFRKQAEALGLNLYFDSAGTSANHVGEASDPRSIRHAENRGYPMRHRARQISIDDFARFDLILTMDDSNFQNVQRLYLEYQASRAHSKDPEALRGSPIRKVTDFCQQSLRPPATHIPDPYYGSAADFELVIDLLENAAEGFFNQLQSGATKS